MPSSTSVYDPPRDGSCFYHAVVKALTVAHPAARRYTPLVNTTEPVTRQVRQLHIDAMRAVERRARRNSDLKPHMHKRVEMYDTDRLTVTMNKLLNRYVALIPEQTGDIGRDSWATELEVVATADLVQHPISVHVPNAPAVRYVPDRGEARDWGSPLVLHLANEHYTLDVAETQRLAGATATVRAVQNAAKTSKASKVSKVSGAVSTRTKKNRSMSAEVERLYRELDDAASVLADAADTPADVRRQDEAVHRVEAAAQSVAATDPAFRRRLEQAGRRLEKAGRRAGDVAASPSAGLTSSIVAISGLCLWSVWAATLGVFAA